MQGDEDEPSLAASGGGSEEEGYLPFPPALVRIYQEQQQRRQVAVVDLAVSGGEDDDEQETQELDTNDDEPLAVSVARISNVNSQRTVPPQPSPSAPALTVAGNGSSGDSDNAELMVVTRPQPTALKKGRKRLRSAVNAPPAPIVITKAQPTECTICYDPCMISGRHRLVALKCGHLFGKKCIERWVLVRYFCLARDMCLV